MLSRFNQVRSTALMNRLLMVFSLAGLFTVTAFAQTAAFEGNVKDEQGKPLAGAQIKIDRLEVRGNYKVKTDKKGHYFYGGLPTGNYKITVEVAGQDKDFRNGVHGGAGSSTAIDFDLATAKAASGAAAAPDESGRALTAAEKAEREKTDKANSAAMAKNKALNEAFNAGKTAAAAGDWNAAIDAFTKGTEVGPDQHVVWGNLADAYVGRAKRDAATRDSDTAKAVETYQKAISLKAEDPAYHNNLALALAQQKKFDDAQVELTKAAQYDPASAGKYFFNLGAVYVNTGNTDRAVTAFKTAIDRDPNYSEAYYQYGVSLMGKASVDDKGKTIAPPGTSEAFQKYLELSPTGANVEPAKAMLQALGSSIETGFARPGQKSAPATKKK